MKSRSPLNVRPLAGLGLLLLAGGALVPGCGGGAATKNPFYNQNTGLFTSADQPAGKGVARTFTEMKNGIPVRQGMEFTPAALEGYPTEPPNSLTVPFIGPMPSTTNGSPFTNVFLAYLTSHPATMEPAHFHLAMLIRPATVTAEPFTHERAAVAPAELPADYIRTTNTLQPGGIVVAGGGVIYDDRSEPEGLPPATTLGQNYLYYDGHMNGMVLGPTLEQMRSKQTMVQAIKQPAVYPRDGYYPQTWTVSYDATRNVHVIEMTDFKRADKFATPGS